MFLLFLDCVWQTLQQFPLSFEFTEQFLHLLLTHSYSSEYGRLSLLCAAVAVSWHSLCHGVPCVIVSWHSLCHPVCPVSRCSLCHSVMAFPVSPCVPCVMVFPVSWCYGIPCVTLRALCHGVPCVIVSWHSLCHPACPVSWCSLCHGILCATVCHGVPCVTVHHGIPHVNDCIVVVFPMFPVSLRIIGTFLYDTTQERHKNGHQTHSLWSHLAQPQVSLPLRNPLYDRNSSVLLLSVSHLTVVCFHFSLLHSLTRSPPLLPLSPPLPPPQTLWQQLYVREGLESTLVQPGHTAKARLREKNTELMEQLAAVRTQLAALRAAAHSQLEGRGREEPDKLEMIGVQSCEKS